MPYFYSDLDPEVAPGRHPSATPLERDPHKPLLFAKVPNTANTYWASTDGDVYKEQPYDRSLTKIKVTLNAQGYRIIMVDGKQVYLARIILTTFRGEPPLKCNVSYVARDRFMMCNLANLKWNHALSDIDFDTAYKVYRDHTNGQSKKDILRHYNIGNKIYTDVILLGSKGGLDHSYNTTYLVDLYEEPPPNPVISAYKSIAEAWGEGQYYDSSLLIQPYTNQKDHQPTNTTAQPNMAYSLLNIGIMMDVTKQTNDLGYFRIFDYLHHNYPKIQKLIKLYQQLPLTHKSDMEGTASDDPKRIAHLQRLKLYNDIDSDRILYYNAYRAYTNKKPFDQFTKEQYCTPVHRLGLQNQNEDYVPISLPWDQHGRDIPNKPFYYFGIEER